MKLKTILSTLALGGISALPLTANPPLVSIGEHVDVRALFSVTAKHEDNVFLRDSAKKSDYSFTFSPGVEVNLGRGQTNGSLDFIYREDIVRYSDLSNLDTSSSNFLLAGNYTEAKYTIKATASWRQLQQNTADAALVGTLVKRELTNVGVRGEYRLSELFSVGSGVSYDRTAYKHGNFRNSDNLNIPVDLYYHITEKYALSAGYNFRDTTVSQGANRQTHFFNVGIRGEVLPKLNAEFRIGYNYVDYSQHKNRDGLGFNGSFSYAVTPKLTLKAGIRKDFTTVADGSVTDTIGGTLTAAYDINPLWTASANVGYSEQDYKSGYQRKDKITHAGVGISYTPLEYLQLSGHYSLHSNSSSISGLGYTNNVFSLTASLRY